MIMPTACNLDTLCGFESAREVLEASAKRPVVPVLPTLVEENGRKKLVIPEEAGYGPAEEHLRDVLKKTGGA